ncbi:MAG: metal ABC transporter permease [Elusimicrobia bacterium]|nr:metal ABC transporter permease [Elusimicrobiota bacterium]
MTQLLQMLSPDFLLHHALYGSVVVGFVCPLVGVYFVLRRLVFWGVALPEVAAAGIAFAFMLQGFGWTFFAGGETAEKHLAILGAVVFTVAAIVVLTWLEQKGAGLSEGRVGVLYALAAAAAILCVAWNAQGETEMLSLLKGEIVTISESDFHAMLDILLAVCAAMFLFQREFLLVSYDRDMAVTLGRSVAFWDGLLYLLIGVTISLGVMTVGPLVIFGLLVVPPMIALPWARGMRGLSVLASLAGGVSAFGGFYFSYRLDLPLGPLIVVALCALYGASSLLRALVPARR